MAKKFRSGSGFPGIGYPDPPLENSGQSVECNIGMFLPYSLEIVSPFPLRTRSEIVFHNFFFP